jgi:hypothetical protein
MKPTYAIHSDQGYVESAFEGPITLVDMGLHIQDMWADPRWNPTLNGIMDFSRARLELSDDDLKTLTKSMLRDPRCSLARFAMVVSTAEDFAVLRKVDVLSDGQSTLRIFFSRKEAAQWLLQPQNEGRDKKGR